MKLVAYFYSTHHTNDAKQRYHSWYFYGRKSALSNTSLWNRISEITLKFIRIIVYYKFYILTYLVRTEYKTYPIKNLIPHVIYCEIYSLFRWPRNFLLFWNWILVVFIKTRHWTLIFSHLNLVHKHEPEYIHTLSPPTPMFHFNIVFFSMSSSSNLSHS